MLSRIKLLHYLFALALFLIVSPSAFSQALNSNTASIALTAILGESLTIAAGPGAGVTFNLVAGGVAPASAPVTVTTTWVLSAGRANVVLDGYFANATAALTSGGASPTTIPTSAVQGSVTAQGQPATAFAPFTSTAALGPAGAGLTLFTLPLTSSNRSGTRTDTLTLQINLTGINIPAATYTGTLVLQAQAL